LITGESRVKRRFLFPQKRGRKRRKETLKEGKKRGNKISKRPRNPFKGRGGGKGFPLGGSKREGKLLREKKENTAPP